ncbi:hypothetical protein CQ040_15615 [Microbacterium sp. MYb54]|nr:hypothetical protein CQ031_15465 [Microbacterium sp. MYb40]PRB19495.1 hypothetical protein CQ040_15615 [Microbacterium sp. MYb54]PRB24798.1 hypothetical protein CQ037_15880 [Microbacterium sp. MYb50]PRB63004.1 hypothetical protein CQ021_17050 [Microbacterium sp. MYb24]PRB71823.1 hypothetical protein CQ027_16055 [Microbacterium sp. MYb32]
MGLNASAIDSEPSSARPIPASVMRQVEVSAASKFEVGDGLGLGTALGLVVAVGDGDGSVLGVEHATRATDVVATKASLNRRGELRIRTA